jgi:hypothetical protein
VTYGRRKKARQPKWAKFGVEKNPKAANGGRKSKGTRPSRRTQKPAKIAGARRRAAAALADAIRIVPLYTLHFEAAPKQHLPPGPRLTYRGGPLIGSVQVFTIFWGAAWKGAQSATLTQLNQFFDYITSSSLMDQLAEYNVSGYNISHGRHIGTTTIDSPSGASIMDSAIQQTLQQLIASSNVPQPTSDTLYFFYLPPEVQVVMGGSASCRAFCGYHNHISGQIFYAALPFPGCPGCLGSLALFDALTSTSSHELCEAITDPIPGQGW